MRSAVASLARLMVVVMLASAALTPPPAPQNLPSGETPVSGIYPEVRLRKLHLVRPDLIPYPIAYEVCC